MIGSSGGSRGGSGTSGSSGCYRLLVGSSVNFATYGQEEIKNGT